MKQFFSMLILGSIVLLGWACQEAEPFVRRLGYPRIDLPQKTEYQDFQSSGCPFTFQYPKGGKLVRHHSDSCWVDISFPSYGCKWHITYREVESSGKSMDIHLEEWRRLIFQHSKKASRIQDHPIEGPAGKGFMYEVYGDVGTPAQVFFADSTRMEVMMTSFYFDTALKNDSLQPIIDYMKGELHHMVQTLQWD